MRGGRKDATSLSVHSPAKNVCALEMKDVISTDANGQSLDSLGNFFCLQLVVPGKRNVTELKKQFLRHIFFQLATRSPSSKMNIGSFEY